MKLPKPDPMPVFIRLCQAKGLPVPIREFVFAKPRQWRFDLAWLDALVALEVEGGAFVKGRHTRGAGFRNDIEKYNRAVVLGWRVVRVLPEQLMTPATFEMLGALLRGRGPAAGMRPWYPPAGLMA